MFLLDSAVALRENAHGRSADHCDGRISAIGSGHRSRNGKNKYVRRVRQPPWPPTTRRSTGNRQQALHFDLKHRWRRPRYLYVERQVSGNGYDRCGSISDSRERPSPRRKALAAQLILVGNAQYRWYEREP